MFVCKKCLLDPICIDRCEKYNMKKFHIDYIETRTRLKRFIKNRIAKIRYRRYIVRIYPSEVSFIVKDSHLRITDPDYVQTCLRYDDSEKMFQTHFKILKDDLKGLKKVVKYK